MLVKIVINNGVVPPDVYKCAANSVTADVKRDIGTIYGAGVLKFRELAVFDERLVAGNYEYVVPLSLAGILLCPVVFKKMCFISNI